MKKIIYLSGIVVLLMSCATLFASDKQSWQELKSDHFIIFHGGNEKFAKEVADRAELYYKNIATDLGYPRYSDFWTWDKRVKIYIYPDQQRYINSTNAPAWSQGLAEYELKTISSFETSQQFLESLLPHEIAHLIFRDFVGFKGEIPRWLDEGVAQWAEDVKRDAIKAMIRQLYYNDALLSLNDLMKINVMKITDSDKVYIRTNKTKENDKGLVFLSGENLVNTYYLQAVSIVGFLIESYGSYSFAEFCRQLREAKPLDEALRFAYPAHIRSLEDLEAGWRKYIAR